MKYTVEFFRSRTDYAQTIIEADNQTDAYTKAYTLTAKLRRGEAVVKWSIDDVTDTGIGLSNVVQLQE